MIYSRRHYNKLLRLIRALSITVKEKKRHPSPFGLAHCFSTKQSITIGINDPFWLVINGLSHELGHCLSVRQGSLCSMSDMIAYRMGAILNRAHARRVLNEERRAWRLGFKFLRDNGIPVDKRMYQAKRILLKSHKKLHAALLLVAPK